MIDTHCHLGKEDYEDIETIIKNMKDGYMIAAGVNDQTNQEVVNLCQQYKNVYGVIGIHPNEVNTCNESSLDWIESNLQSKKIVGIGEIGLDYHYGIVDKELQIEIFKRQLDLARKYKVPVVIHSRDSIEDIYHIMSQYNGVQMIIHCYSGSVEMAKKFLKLGVYFGIGGVLTFKNAKVLKEVVSILPLDHILLETDSPYLTPEPYRGERNEPRNILLVAEKIAEIKGISVKEVLDVTTSNAIKKFDLKDPL